MARRPRRSVELPPPRQAMPASQLETRKGRLMTRAVGKVRASRRACALVASSPLSSRSPCAARTYGLGRRRERSRRGRDQGRCAAGRRWRDERAKRGRRLRHRVRRRSLRHHDGLGVRRGQDTGRRRRSWVRWLGSGPRGDSPRGRGEAMPLRDIASLSLSTVGEERPARPCCRELHRLPQSCLVVTNS